jgi:hypothetical protein
MTLMSLALPGMPTASSMKIFPNFFVIASEDILVGIPISQPLGYNVYSSCFDPELFILLGSIPWQGCSRGWTLLMIGCDNDLLQLVNSQFALSKLFTVGFLGSVKVTLVVAVLSICTCDLRKRAY